MHWKAPLEPLAQTAAHLARQYQAASDPHVARVYRSLLGHLCRELEDICPRYVSEQAAAKARERGLEDLREFHWDDQVSKMKDVGRQIFHWEHMVPVSQLCEELLELADVTEARATAILNKAGIAWILKDEDRTLTAAGARSYREDSKATYERLGIMLVT